MTAKPVILAVYLLTISVTAFAMPQSVRPYGVLFFLLLQIFLLAITKTLSFRTFRAVWKLKFLFLFLVLCYGLLPDEAETSQWWQPVSAVSFWINLTGVSRALLLCGQISLVVLTSHFVSNVSTPQALTEGLRHLWMSPLLAQALSDTLTQIQDSENRGGRGMGGGGGGGGGGRGRGGGGGGGGRNRWQQLLQTDDAEGQKPLTLKERVQRLPDKLRGLVHPLGDRLYRQFHPGPEDDQSPIAHDAKVIAGIAAVMLSMKAMKFLPGIPFASGHKAIIFIPLYLVAADRTHSRWGASTAGLIMGLVAFVNGDGRYGIFEVFKHLAPGFVIDLVWPLVRRWQRNVFVLTAVGVLAGIARVATEFSITLCLGFRWELYAFPATKLVPNLLAGALSGLVSAPLLTYLALRDVQTQDVEENRCDGNGESPHDQPETCSDEPTPDPPLAQPENQDVEKNRCNGNGESPLDQPETCSDEPTPDPPLAQPENSSIAREAEAT